MSPVKKFIEDLNSGMIIDTCNETCKRYGVTSITDLARKAKNMGYDPTRTYETVKVRGDSTRVVKYSKP